MTDPNGWKSLLVGVDGPAVVVTGEVAALIAGAVHLEADRHRSGATPPAVVAELDATARALDAAGRLHRRTQMSAHGHESGPHGDISGGGVPPAPDAGRGKALVTGEVADLLGVTPRQIRRLIAGGVLPGEQIAGRWTVDQAALDNYRNEDG